MRYRWMLALILAAVSARAEDAGKLKLSLAELTQSALQNSPKLQAANFDREAARSRAGAAGAAELPRLSLDGMVRYQTEVPTFSLIPGGPAFTFGDHLNYNAGAALNWTLWDFRSLHQMADSATAASSAQGEAARSIQRQVLLAVRLAYFQTQTHLEQVRLLADSLKSAQAQYSDIETKTRLGAASRMDLLSAHQEVLSYERQFRQAQTSLSHSLRDFFALVGVEEPGNFSLPLDERMEGKLPKGVPAATVWLSMDAKEESLKALQKETRAPPDDSAPQLKTYAYLAESARQASGAAHSQLFPRITVSARSGFEYPNGPVLETIQQNTVGAALSVPLFDWGGILNESDAKKRQSESYLSNLRQAKADLWRDWNKAQDLLASIQYQQELDREAVSETDELAGLTYESYRAGRARFLEVESANIRALGAKVQAFRDDVQVLMQLSVLSSLSGKE